MTKLLRRYESLILLVGLMILLRIPSLFEPAWYGDENIYLSIGQGVRKGLVLYRDITDFPNKPPLIYLLAAGVQTVFWFRFVLLIWNGIHTVVVFLFLKELYPNKKWVHNLFTLLFILFSSLPFWEGNIANGEIFMTMPVTAGMLLLWRARYPDKVEDPRSKHRDKIKAYLWAGVLFALGFLFKIPVALDIAAAGLFFFIFSKTQAIKNLHVFLLGLIIPIGLALGFHATSGVSPLSLISTASGSAGYVSVWQPQEGFSALINFSTLFSRAILLGFVTSLLFLVRNKVSRKGLFLSLWLIFALFGALLSARPYPHYLLQIVPALVLLLSVIVAEGFKKKVVLVGLLALMLGGAAILRFGFGTYPTFSYYQNFFGHITGKLSADEYYDSFDGRMSRNYQVAQYLRERTGEEEKIYIWGTEPGIYVISNRLPVGRLVTSFHVSDLDEFEVLGEQIANEMPRYIVMMTSEPRDFPRLEQLVESRYTLNKVIKEAQIYHRIPEVGLASGVQ